MAVQVFGAGAVQTAYVSYLTYDITPSSITLVWSDAYVDVPYIDPVTGIHYQSLAAYMDVITAADNIHTITLPDATQTSVGQNFIISNKGLSDFQLNTSDGALLQNVSVGIKYFAVLTDNSTPAGLWDVATFAAGTSQASAVALAGNGLVALIDKLNTNIPVILTNAPVVIDATYRATLLVYTGGGATFTLPPIASVPAGYYLSFSNQGGGQVIIQPTAHIPLTTIQGVPTLAVEPLQSLTIISDGTNWQTLGFGQSQFAVAQVLNLNVGGNVNVTLTISQSSRVIQEYSGALTGDITVFFPVQVNNWFIANKTTGAHTLSVQLINTLTSAPVGTTYVIPQGSTQTFYSDGTSLFSATTALSLIDGTATLPALSFSSNPGTGILSGGGELAISINGVITVGFRTSGTTGEMALSAANNTLLELISDNTTATISYNSVPAISINNLGAVTLPAKPLDIASGGTNSFNQQDAITQLMPPAAAGGLAYFDGTDWITLPVGTPGQTLTVGAGNTLVWA